MDPLIEAILGALWFILPAYFANSAPVDVSQIESLKKYGKPIDGGKTWRGARILGDGKTWRGLFAGVIAGTLAGSIQFFLEPSLAVSYPYFTGMTIPLAFMLSLGALIGDMVASFVKRRVNLKPGDPAPLLDQLDFIFGAMLFAWAWNALMLGQLNGVFQETIGYQRFFILIIITPVVHLAGNLLAWVWKLKKNPW